jgi:hypothetical protein
MKVSGMLARARAALGYKTVYLPGQGGFDPAARDPRGAKGGCDCSGFVCWALGIGRKTDHPLYVRLNGGWINTDAIVHDAGQPTGYFEPLEQPRRGCLLVFPKPPTMSYGHVGIVTRVARGRAAKVIHCSATNFRTAGDAMQETGPEVFERPGAIYAWYVGVER